LTEALIETLNPIQDNYRSITSDKGYLESVLRDGKDKAEAIANQTLNKVKTALGFSLP
jgi:tryptophanyl-tRNA synthetase